MLIQQVLQVKAILGVITLPPSATISNVIKVLSKKRIGGIVISSDKNFVRELYLKEISLKSCLRMAPLL